MNIKSFIAFVLVIVSVAGCKVANAESDITRGTDSSDPVSKPVVYGSCGYRGGNGYYFSPKETQLSCNNMHGTFVLYNSTLSISNMVVESVEKSGTCVRVFKYPTDYIFSVSVMQTETGCRAKSGTFVSEDSLDTCIFANIYGILETRHNVPRSVCVSYTFGIFIPQVN